MQDGLDDDDDDDDGLSLVLAIKYSPLPPSFLPSFLPSIPPSLPPSYLPSLLSTYPAWPYYSPHFPMSNSSCRSICRTLKKAWILKLPKSTFVHGKYHSKTQNFHWKGGVVHKMHRGRCLQPPPPESYRAGHTQQGRASPPSWRVERPVKSVK
jgi:hypothetical protein